LTRLATASSRTLKKNFSATVPGMETSAISPSHTQQQAGHGLQAASADPG